MNDMILHYNLNGVTGAVGAGRLQGVMDDSQTSYGADEDSTTIKSFLVQGTSGLITNAVFRRFLFSQANPIGFYKFGLLPEHWLNEPADYVELTHTQIPDIAAGTVGITTQKGIIVGQSFEALSENLDFDVMTWEAEQDVTLGSQATIESGDIDDTTLAFDSDHTVTTNAADAYWDVDQTYADCWALKFTLSVTPPGSGSSHHWIAIEINAIESAAVVDTRLWRGLRYLSSESTAFTLDLIFYRDYNAAASPPQTDITTALRYKLDYFALSCSNNIKFIKF